MKLEMMTDIQLHQSLLHYVKREKAETIEVLRHLVLILKRRSFADHGATSLFNYCVDCLGYTRAESYARVCATKLMAENVGVEEKLERGTLGLSTATELYGRMKKEEEGSGIKLTPEKKEEIIGKVDGLSARETTKILDIEFPAQTPKEKKRNFQMDESTYRDLQRLKIKMGLKTEEEVLKILVAEKEKSLDVPKKEIKKEKGTLPLKLGRYIPKKIKLLVMERANYQCEFISPINGLRCEAREDLQYDHVQLYCRKGASDETNLRVACGQHNRRLAILDLGFKKMDPFINGKYMGRSGSNVQTRASS